MADAEQDDAPEVVKELSRKAAIAIALRFARTSSFKRRSFADGPYFHDVFESVPTEEQIASVAGSPAIASVTDLIREAYKHGGYPCAGLAADVAERFFTATGMVYRLRAQKVESEYRKGGIAPLDEVPPVWPDRIVLWMTPTLSSEVRQEGSTSMATVDRDGLIQCAEDFFQSGIRCPWFEKMLLEALIAAEYYGTLKAAMTNATLWTGKPSIAKAFAMDWAFEKSRGGGSSYLTYLVLANTFVAIVKAAAFLGFFWWAYSSYAEKATWENILALIVICLSGLTWLGKFITRSIVSWATPQRSVLFKPERHVFVRALEAINRAANIVQARSMSTTLLRDAVLEAWRHNAYFDQIVMPYLDRACAAKEYLWTKRIERSHTFYDTN